MPPIPIDDELRARLQDAEDALVERKESAHLQAVKAAAVGFANTLAEGTSGVLFIGVRNDGKPTGALGDVDAVQKKVRGYLSECHPPLPYRLYAVDVVGAQVVAVVISPSKDKPHFTGKSYVRVGSETVEASADGIGQLLDQRNSLVATLKPYVGRPVTVMAERMAGGNRVWDGTQKTATLVEVTPHYVRIHYEPSIPDSGISLGRIALEWDFGANRPKLRVSL
jgi:hypothetical protein